MDDAEFQKLAHAVGRAIKEAELSPEQAEVLYDQIAEAVPEQLRAEFELWVCGEIGKQMFARRTKGQAS